MDWLEITVSVTREGIDPVGGLLLACGLNGYQIEDEQDFLDFLENNRPFWNYVDEDLREKMRGQCCLKFYVTNNEAGFETLTRVKDALEALAAREEGLGTLTLQNRTLSEEDWANAWKKYYKPFPVGKRLWIRPQWEEASVPEGRVEFINNPGMSFGTGSHQSTRLCLTFLDELVQGGEKMLDLGCGSGILSIASLLLGAKYALGVDIDKNAADIAARNAADNGLGADRFVARAGNILSDQALREEFARTPWDLIAANIVADVIIPLAPFVPTLLAEGGKFICSGIIVERAEEVVAALNAAGLSVIARREEGGWAALMAVVK